MTTLFRSSQEMAAAHNFNDWTFRQFAPYLRGCVLEVGCGVGTFTARIYAQCTSLRAIDRDPDAIAHCRNQIGRAPFLSYECTDVCDVHNAMFDTIICMNVLEHIADDVATVRHMLSLLAPGGVLFLLVPAHQWLFNSFDTAAGHVRRYTKKSMTQLLMVAAPRPYSFEQWYMNPVGALGYYAVYNLLGVAPATDGAARPIAWFDRYVVPVMRRIEGRRMPFGLSLVTVVKAIGP